MVKHEKIAAWDIIGAGMYAFIGIASGDQRPYALTVAALLIATAAMRKRRPLVAFGLNMVAIPIMVLGLIAGVNGVAS